MAAAGAARPARCLARPESQDCLPHPDHHGPLLVCGTYPAPSADSTQSAVATLVRSIYAQPDRDSTHAQFRRVVEHLEGRFPQAAELLADAQEGAVKLTGGLAEFADEQRTAALPSASVPA